MINSGVTVLLLFFMTSVGLITIRAFRTGISIALDRLHGLVSYILKGVSSTILNSSKVYNIPWVYIHNIVIKIINLI